MRVSFETLRRMGSRRVVVSTDDGDFTGRFIANAIDDRAVVVLFTPDGSDPREPIVIDVERIASVAPSPN